MVDKISKVISTAASTANRVETSVSLSEPDAAWVAERQSVLTANRRGRKTRQGSERGKDTEGLEKDGQANRPLDLHPSNGKPDDELAADRLSGESERIGTGNLDDEVPFGEHVGYV